VVDLGHNFGLRVVAEGVENQESADLLASWGCDVAQGYLYSKPLSPKNFHDWMTERGGQLETITSLPAPAPPAARPATSTPSASQGDRGSAVHDASFGGAASPTDRRRAVRYDAMDAPALIAWVDGDQSHKVTVSLKNISAVGALVETDYEPLPGPETVVLFRLVSNATEHVVSARLAGISRPPLTRGRFSFLKKQAPIKPRKRLHLAFLESCTYDFYKASIGGLGAARR
jgi:hypothetical protein